MSRESAFWLVARQACRSRPQLAALAEQLNLAFGVFELGVAEFRELDASRVELERFLERQVAAFFQFLDDRLELGDRCFEILDSVRGFAHSAVVTLAAIAPRLKPTCTVSPCLMAAA